MSSYLNYTNNGKKIERESQRKRNSDRAIERERGQTHDKFVYSGIEIILCVAKIFAQMTFISIHSTPTKHVKCELIDSRNVLCSL